MSIVEGNEQVSLGVTYQVDADKGILVVAYPSKDVNTHFIFNYWLGPAIAPVVELNTDSLSFLNEYGLYFAGASGICLICVILGSFIAYRRLKKKI